MREAYSKVLERIAQASKGTSIRPRLIAVSKTFPIAAIRELYELGQRDFGENYAQELLEKSRRAQALGLKEIRWHFIGPLQTNKCKSVAPLVHAIHTIDRERVWGAIHDQIVAGQTLEAYVQVNIDAEPTKSGIMPEELQAFLDRATRYPKVKIAGLMAIPNPENDPSSAFIRMRGLRDQCLPGCRLSMGMSADFERAIREGATDVRVGSLIFGERARR